jgi:WhiB family transcriptional regulator, redox-sensing transcriptional regulator
MGPLVDMQSTDTQSLTRPNTPPFEDAAPLRYATSDWEAHAVCRSVDDAGELFFSEDIGDIAAAKRVCAECPVLAPCLEGALERREPWGVWGGQLFMNGKMLTVKRRRGRPPKVARPEDQMPIVPVPDHLVARAERRTA